MRLATLVRSTWLLLAGLAQGSPVEHEYGPHGVNASLASSSGGDEDNATFARAAPPVRVPGESTVWHCKGTGPDDRATLDYINMLPRVLSRNSEVSIKTAGWIHEKVEAGAMVEISAKYSIIPIKIINRKDELCSLIGQVGLSCPIEAGAVAFDKTTTIPNRMIPSGMYHIKVKAYTKEGAPLICLDIDQKFK